MYFAERGDVEVVDGDTLLLSGHKFRLEGFDSPEFGTHCEGLNIYSASSKYLGQLIEGEDLKCEGKSFDQYGRNVGTCSIGSRDIGELMVKAGWARDWPKYSNGAYTSAEKEARANNNGIWGLSCDGDEWSGRDYSTD